MALSYVYVLFGEVGVVGGLFFRAQMRRPRHRPERGSAGRNQGAQERSDARRRGGSFRRYLLSQHPVPGDHPSRRGRDRLRRSPHGGCRNSRSAAALQFRQKIFGMETSLLGERNSGARPPVDWPIAAGRHHLALRLAASRRWPDVIRGIECLHLDRSLFQQDVARHLWRSPMRCSPISHRQSVEHYHWLPTEARC